MSAVCAFVYIYRGRCYHMQHDNGNMIYCTLAVFTAVLYDLYRQLVRVHCLAWLEKKIFSY